MEEERSIFDIDMYEGKYRVCFKRDMTLWDYASLAMDVISVFSMTKFKNSKDAKKALDKAAEIKKELGKTGGQGFMDNMCEFTELKQFYDYLERLKERKDELTDKQIIR